MKRLVDGAGDDRLSARASELVRAMGPTPASAERLQRVRRSLDAPARSAPRWAWRMSLALGLLGVSAAAAAAGTALSGAFSTEPAPPVRHVVAPAEPRVPRAPGPAQLEPAPVAPVSPAEVAPSAPTPSASVPRQPPAVLSDVARVHEAAKALRHEGDPERALRLLERPGTRIAGPLAEEALALRIEASVAKGDGRQAKLAAAYLAQYPNGRYRELAKKALAGRQP